LQFIPPALKAAAGQAMAYLNAAFQEDRQDWRHAMQPVGHIQIHKS